MEPPDDISVSFNDYSSTSLDSFAALHLNGKSCIKIVLPPEVDTAPIDTEVVRYIERNSGKTNLGVLSSELYKASSIGGHWFGIQKSSHAKRIPPIQLSQSFENDETIAELLRLLRRKNLEAVVSEEKELGPRCIMNDSILAHLNEGTGSIRDCWNPSKMKSFFPCQNHTVTTAGTFISPITFEPFDVAKVNYSLPCSKSKLWVVIPREKQDILAKTLRDVRGVNETCVTPILHNNYLCDYEFFGYQNIEPTVLLQRPNEYVVIAPGSCYITVSVGNTVAEEVNFYTDGIIPKMNSRRRCTCSAVLEQYCRIPSLTPGIGHFCERKMNEKIHGPDIRLRDEYAADIRRELMLIPENLRTFTANQSNDADDEIIEESEIEHRDHEIQQDPHNESLSVDDGILQRNEQQDLNEIQVLQDGEQLNDFDDGVFHDESDAVIVDAAVDDVAVAGDAAVAVHAAVADSLVLENEIPSGDDIRNGVDTVGGEESEISEENVSEHAVYNANDLQNCQQTHHQINDVQTSESNDAVVETEKDSDNKTDLHGANESPVRPPVSPLRPQASPVQAVTSPVQAATSPVQATASPLRAQASRVQAASSPVQATASPLRPPFSPLRPPFSPLRPQASRVQAATSPLRPQASPSSNKNATRDLHEKQSDDVYQPTNDLSNSPLSRSPVNNHSVDFGSRFPRSETPLNNVRDNEQVRKEEGGEVEDTPQQPNQLQSPIHLNPDLRQQNGQSSSTSLPPSIPDIVNNQAVNANPENIGPVVEESSDSSDDDLSSKKSTHLNENQGPVSAKDGAVSSGSESDKENDGNGSAVEMLDDDVDVETENKGKKPRRTCKKIKQLAPRPPPARRSQPSTQRQAKQQTQRQTQQQTQPRKHSQGQRRTQPLSPNLSSINASNKKTTREPARIVSSTPKSHPSNSSMDGDDDDVEMDGNDKIDEQDSNAETVFLNDHHLDILQRFDKKKHEKLRYQNEKRDLGRKKAKDAERPNRKSKDEIAKWFERQFNNLNRGINGCMKAIQKYRNGVDKLANKYKSIDDVEKALNQKRETHAALKKQQELVAIVKTILGKKNDLNEIGPLQYLFSTGYSITEVVRQFFNQGSPTDRYLFTEAVKATFSTEQEQQPWIEFITDEEKWNEFLSIQEYTSELTSLPWQRWISEAKLYKVKVSNSRKRPNSHLHDNLDDFDNDDDFGPANNDDDRGDKNSGNIGNDNVFVDDFDMDLGSDRVDSLPRLGSSDIFMPTLNSDSKSSTPSWRKTSRQKSIDSRVLDFNQDDNAGDLEGMLHPIYEDEEEYSYNRIVNDSGNVPLQPSKISNFPQPPPPKKSRQSDEHVQQFKIQEEHDELMDMINDVEELQRNHLHERDKKIGESGKHSSSNHDDEIVTLSDDEEELSERSQRRKNSVEDAQKLIDFSSEQAFIDSTLKAFKFETDVKKIDESIQWGAIPIYGSQLLRLCLTKGTNVRGVAKSPWLSDILISEYLELIGKAFPRCVVGDITIVSDPRAALKRSRKPGTSDLNDILFFIAPILKVNHFTLYVADFEKRSYYLYDSDGSLQKMSNLEDEISNITFYVEQRFVCTLSESSPVFIPRQPNGYACGDHICFYVIQLLRGTEERTVPENYRMLMLAELLNGKLFHVCTELKIPTEQISGTESEIAETEAAINQRNYEKAKEMVQLGSMEAFLGTTRIAFKIFAKSFLPNDKIGVMEAKFGQLLKLVEQKTVVKDIVDLYFELLKRYASFVCPDKVINVGKLALSKRTYGKAKIASNNADLFLAPIGDSSHFILFVIEVSKSIYFCFDPAPKSKNLDKFKTDIENLKQYGELRYNCVLEAGPSQIVNGNPDDSGVNICMKARHIINQKPFHLARSFERRLMFCELLYGSIYDEPENVNSGNDARPGPSNAIPQQNSTSGRNYSIFEKTGKPPVSKAPKSAATKHAATKSAATKSAATKSAATNSKNVKNDAKTTSKSSTANTSKQPSKNTDQKKSKSNAANVDLNADCKCVDSYSTNVCKYFEKFYKESVDCPTRQFIKKHCKIFVAKDDGKKSFGLNNDITLKDLKLVMTRPTTAKMILEYMKLIKERGPKLCVTVLIGNPEWGTVKFNKEDSNENPPVIGSSKIVAAAGVESTESTNGTSQMQFDILLVPLTIPVKSESVVAQVNHHVLVICDGVEKFVSVYDPMGCDETGKFLNDSNEILEQYDSAMIYVKDYIDRAGYQWKDFETLANIKGCTSPINKKYAESGTCVCIYAEQYTRNVKHINIENIALRREFMATELSVGHLFFNESASY